MCPCIIPVSGRGDGALGSGFLNPQNKPLKLKTLDWRCAPAFTYLINWIVVAKKPATASHSPPPPSHPPPRFVQIPCLHFSNSYTQHGDGVEWTWRLAPSAGCLTHCVAAFPAPFRRALRPQGLSLLQMSTQMLLIATEYCPPLFAPVAIL